MDARILTHLPTGTTTTTNTTTINTIHINTTTNPSLLHAVHPGGHAQRGEVSGVTAMSTGMWRVGLRRATGSFPCSALA